MRYSQQVLDMLKRGVSGDVDDYYDFFLELTAKLGEDEAFADSLIAENEPLFDVINDEPMYLFLCRRRYREQRIVPKFFKDLLWKSKTTSR